METNEFKTMEMVRRIRDAQYERTKHMSNEEKLAYYEEQSQALMEQLSDLIEEWQQERIPA